MKVRVLEIGSGQRPYLGKEGEEVLHLDKTPFPDVEVVWDLENTPYPFPDDTFDKIIARHCLEHISDTVKVMNELWRIGKNGARVFIQVPYYSSYLAFQDPTHQRFFHENTFNYFTEKGPRPLPTSKTFSRLSLKYHYQYPALFSFFDGCFPFLSRFLRNHFLNVVKEIEVELMIVK